MKFRFSPLVSTTLLDVMLAATGLWLAGGCAGTRVEGSRSGTKDFVAGWEAVGNKDWGEAENAFSQLMRDYPQSPEGYFGLGVVCAERQEYELAEARQLIEQAIAMAPENGENHFAMAVYWAYCEDYPQIWNCVHQAEAHGYVVPQEFVEQVRLEELKASAPSLLSRQALPTLTAAPLASASRLPEYGCQGIEREQTK